MATSIWNDTYRIIKQIAVPPRDTLWRFKIAANVFVVSPVASICSIDNTRGQCFRGSVDILTNTGLPAL